MRRALAILFAWAFLALPLVPPHAQEIPLEDDRAGMCDAFEGLSFTFCVALCEARECDLLAAGDTRCALLRRGFERAAAGAVPPCTFGVASAVTAPVE
jgi:hypothetical protein